MALMVELFEIETIFYPYAHTSGNPKWSSEMAMSMSWSEDPLLDVPDIGGQDVMERSA